MLHMHCYAAYVISLVSCPKRFRCQMYFVIFYAFKHFLKQMPYVTIINYICKFEFKQAAVFFCHNWLFCQIMSLS